MKKRLGGYSEIYTRPNVVINGIQHNSRNL